VILSDLDRGAIAIIPESPLNVGARRREASRQRTELRI
jgi:hypothetical protein